MMRDCWTVPLCGLFLILLSGMCLVAFSAVTVMYYIHFSHTKKIHVDMYTECPGVGRPKFKNVFSNSVPVDKFQ
jgi:hypothetical protein